MSALDDWLLDLGMGFYVKDPDTEVFTPVRFDEGTQFYQQAKEVLKDLMLEVVTETAFAYEGGLAYAEVVKKKVAEL